MYARCGRAIPRKEVKSGRDENVLRFTFTSMLLGLSRKKMFYLELLGTKDGALEGIFLHLQLQGLETGWPAGKALSFLALILLSHPFCVEIFG